MPKVIEINPGEGEILNERYSDFPVVFMALVHPDCPHCEAMKPALQNLYSNLEEYEGPAGIFNIHADEIPGSVSTIPQLKSVNGFPTVMITKNSKSNPIIYNGNRTTEDLMEFCLKNMDLKKITDTKKGGKKRTKKTRKRKTKRKPRSRRKSRSRRK